MKCVRIKTNNFLIEDKHLAEPENKDNYNVNYCAGKH